MNLAVAGISAAKQGDELAKALVDLYEARRTSRTLRWSTSNIRRLLGGQFAVDGLKHDSGEFVEKIFSLMPDFVNELVEFKRQNVKFTCLPCGAVSGSKEVWFLFLTVCLSSNLPS